MLVIISPAKNLCLDAVVNGALAATVPVFLKDADYLVQHGARKLTRAKLKSVLGVSDDLAGLNYDRYQAWDSADTHPSILMFRGDAYRSFKGFEMSPDQLVKAQKCLRILSGIYGLLKPLDIVKPYRMDMSKKLVTEKAKDLYEYWGDRICEQLQKELDAQPKDTRFLVNCASDEYSKAARLNKLSSPVYTMAFPGPAVFAKGARGAMARYIALNEIGRPEDLKKFTGNDGEWKYSESQSSEFKYVFLRDASKVPSGKKAAKGKKGATATKRKAGATEDDNDEVADQALDTGAASKAAAPKKKAKAATAPTNAAKKKRKAASAPATEDETPAAAAATTTTKRGRKKR